MLGLIRSAMADRPEDQVQRLIMPSSSLPASTTDLRRQHGPGISPNSPQRRASSSLAHTTAAFLTPKPLTRHFEALPTYCANTPGSSCERFCRGTSTVAIIATVPVTDVADALTPPLLRPTPSVTQNSHAGGREMCRVRNRGI